MIRFEVQVYSEFISVIAKLTRWSLGNVDLLLRVLRPKWQA
jgi:hypothetical protein